MHRPRPALYAVAALAAAGVAGRAAFDVWHPPFGADIYDHAVIHGLGPTAWLVWHAVVGGPSAVLTFTGLAVLVVVACPQRGAVLAAVGAVLAGLGSLSFCIAIAAEGVAWWYATADDVMDPAAGDQAMAAFAEHPAPVDVPAGLGALAVAVGVLLLLGALWRAAAAPWWLLVATAVLALASAAPLPGWTAVPRVALEAAALLGVGTCALRAATGAPRGLTDRPGAVTVGARSGDS